jgi:hypothetical protein
MSEERAMHGFRPGEQMQPPEARRITDVAIMRFEDVYEVDPALMSEHLTQQSFPNWDTLRIVQARHDHLDWMHRHWAGTVVSGQEILESLD